jgi:hypothetical protein
MDNAPRLTLLPCRYHRFCQSHVDVAQPHQHPLCPDCFAKIDEGYEQVELEEQADRLVAQAQAEELSCVRA